MVRNYNYLPLTVLFCICITGCKYRAGDNPFVTMQTAVGDIVIEVYAKKAPVTSGNFLRYVDEGRFEGASFYRVVRMDNQPNNDIKIEVIQGGIGFLESELRLPSIAHETTQQTGVVHLNGTVSMARAEPGTAGSEFFICINDQPELDFGGRRNPDGQGFAAFGKVVRGMDVVRRIQMMEAEGQMLIAPVKISSLGRLKRESK